MRKKLFYTITTIMLTVVLAASAVTSYATVTADTVVPADKSAADSAESAVKASPKTADADTGDALISESKKTGSLTDGKGLLTYSTSQGGVTVTSCDDGASGPVVIPATFNSMQVVGIDDAAFLYCSSLTSITLPETVKTIGKSAFAYCTGLQSVTIKGSSVSIDDSAFYYCTELTNVNITGSLVSIGSDAFANTSVTALPKLDGVKNIGSRAFQNCKKLKSIYMPDGLESAGDDAFNGCEAAASDVVIPASLKADKTGKNLFYNCKELASVKIPSDWSGIPEGMFYQCWKLSPVTLPQHPSYIGAYAFYNASNAVSLSSNGELIIPSGVTEIGERAYWVSSTGRIKSLKLPSSLKKIGKEAFARSAVLTDISFSEGLEEIEVGAFASTGVTSVVFPSTLKKISTGSINYEVGDAGGAFNHCTKLESITLPEGLEYIGKYAFAHTSLKSMKIPSTVTMFGSNAFSSCNSLTSVEFMSVSSSSQKSSIDTSQWESGIFSGCTNLETISISGSWNSVPASMFASCEKLSHVTIESGVQKIGDRAFYGCEKLVNISLPAGVAYIGEAAFEGCTELKAVSLPEGLKIIGNEAFKECSALELGSLPESIDSIGSQAFKKSSIAISSLPSSLTSIGNEAFAGCKNIKSITVGKLSETKAGSKVFSGCTGLKSAAYTAGAETTGNYWFEKCTLLENVSLPATMKSISRNTFCGCSALKYITLPNGLNNIKNEAFEDTGLKSISIPSSVTSLYSNSFKGSSLTDVSFENGITDELCVISDNYDPTAGEGVYEDGGDPSYAGNGGYFGELGRLDSEIGPFTDCKNLKNIKLADNWTSIPAYLFCKAGTSLGKLELTDKIVSIGAYAFAGCDGLTEIRFGSGIKSIGAFAFYKTGLTSISIPDSVDDDSFGEYAVGNCQSLKNVNLPDSWKKIPAGIFWGNKNLTSYTVKEGITKIEENAFRDSGLKTVSLPSTLESIGIRAFYGSDLETVVIPGSVKTISKYAFCSCKSLKSAAAKNGVNEISDFAFAYCDTLLSVTLPDSTKKLSLTAFYASNPGKVKIIASKNSKAALYAAAVPYLYSDYAPRDANVSFTFTQTLESLVKTGRTDGFSADYKGMKFYFSSSAGDGSSQGDNYNAVFTASLSGCDASITDVKVPDSIMGAAVTSVHIEKSETIKSISCGSGIQYVYMTNCKNLKNAHFSEGVKSIAMSGCTSLESVVIPSTVNADETSSNVGIDFTGCTSLKNVTFNEGLKRLNGGFKDTELTEVWLPASLVYLNPETFDKDVVIHFTGDASKVYYTWFDGNGTQHNDPVAKQLLTKGYKIAQYRGTGLNKINTYFKSAEDAGYTADNTDYVSTGSPASSSGLSDTTDEEMMPDSSPETAAAAAPAASPSSATADHDSESKEGADAVYEVVRKAVTESPLLLIAVILLCAVLAVSGGIHRYRKSKR